MIFLFKGKSKLYTMKKLLTILLISSSISFGQKKDTLKFVVSENGTKVGTAWIIQTTQNEFHSFCDFQGNTTLTKYRVNGDQVITDLITTNDISKQTSEKFTLKNGTANWEVAGQKGEIKTNSAVFLTNLFTADNPLIRALLASPTKKINVLPIISEASTFLTYELTLKNKEKVFLFQINGINNVPNFNWVDDNGFTIGKFFNEKAIVRVGYEQYTENLLRIQKQVEIKALKELEKKPTIARKTSKVSKISPKKKVIVKK
jgi:hypothetical protein